MVEYPDDNVEAAYTGHTPVTTNGKLLVEGGYVITQFLFNSLRTAASTEEVVPMLKRR